MAKTHAFCSDICKLLNLQHKQCKYAHATKVKRHMKNYVSIDINSTTNEQEKHVLMTLLRKKKQMKRLCGVMPQRQASKRLSEVTTIFYCAETW